MLLKIVLSYKSLAVLLLFFSVGYVNAKTCLYVSSYHAGYEWNDGIERGLESVLKDKCTLDRFYMDTKRNKGSDFGKEKGLEAKKYILQTKPDVVVVADDNASRYLVVPHFRDSEIPFVFCGVNWTTHEYGYPYTNVTGMIEVAPVSQTLKAIQDIIKSPRKGIYLSSDVFTEHKDFSRYREVFAEENVRLYGVFVNTRNEWERAFRQAQSADFVVLGNNAGINDWDSEAARKYVRKNSKTFTVTNYDWMMSYAMFAMTKQAEEQGEWAAQVALAILDGEDVSNIPVVINRYWNIYINLDMLDSLDIQVPAYILHKAVRVE